MWIPDLIGRKRGLSFTPRPLPTFPKLFNIISYHNWQPTNRIRQSYKSCKVGQDDRLAISSKLSSDHPHTYGRFIFFKAFNTETFIISIKIMEREKLQTKACTTTVSLKLCDVSEYKHTAMGCFVSSTVFNRIGRLARMAECTTVYPTATVILRKSISCW